MFSFRKSCCVSLVVLFVGIFAMPQALASNCGEGDPETAEWTGTGAEGEPLFRAVFTGREATLACFELLNPQYEKRETTPVHQGVPAWMGEKGPLNLVTTWDTEFLPFSLKFLELTSDKPIERVVKAPTKTAIKEGWKTGEVRTEPVSKLYEFDPTYTLISATADEIVYVWPDPGKDKSEVFVEKKYLRLAGYRIALHITLWNFSAGQFVNQPQLLVHAWEAERKSPGFFSPAPNILEGLCMSGGGDLERETGSDLAEEPLNPPGVAVWTGIGNRYFINALIARGLSESGCTLTAGKNGVLTTALYRRNPFTVNPASEHSCFPDWYKAGDKLSRCSKLAQRLGLTVEQLFVPSARERAFTAQKDLTPEESKELLDAVKTLTEYEGAVLYSFELYLGPKDIDRLKEPEVGLEDSLDFWIVGFLSKPMLYILRWFHSIVSHWGMAIIMLTLLVKLVLLYWTQKSFSQMQRMASLKPKMDQLKEKYGKDKERLNQEMMNLYKREKVNPLGGCLPMLLQMPIWIALYRTIYASVDLYQAPLGLWIHDLSAPDPYFIFPLVLGASMFIQQRLTPTTMDSAQAKMMQYMMPIMFTVFMLFLPSGLNLYILVNTLLSMVQQGYLRKKFAATPAKTAAA